MKIKSLLLVTTLSASFSTLAAEDCNPNRDPFCGDGGGGGLASLGKAAEVLLVSGAVAAGVGLYYIFRNGDEDKETSARMLADYHNGKGLRLIHMKILLTLVCSLQSHTSLMIH